MVPEYANITRGAEQILLLAHAPVSTSCILRIIGFIPSGDSVMQLCVLDLIQIE